MFPDFTKDLSRMCGALPVSAEDAPGLQGRVASTGERGVNWTIIINRTGRPGAWQFLELRPRGYPILYGDCRDREEAIAVCSDILSRRERNRRARLARWIKREISTTSAEGAKGESQ